MNPCPAFVQALSEERDAALAQLAGSHTPESRLEALGRLADLDELERRALSPTTGPVLTH